MTQQGRTGVDPILEDALNAITGESALDGDKKSVTTSDDDFSPGSSDSPPETQDQGLSSPLMDQGFDDFNEEPLLTPETPTLSSFDPEMTFDQSVLGADDSFLSDVMGDGSFADLSSVSSDDELSEPMKHDPLNDQVSFTEVELQKNKAEGSHSATVPVQKNESDIDADIFLVQEPEFGSLVTSDDNSTSGLEPSSHEDDFEPDSLLTTSTTDLSLSDDPDNEFEDSVDALLSSGDTGLLSGMDSTGFDLDGSNGPESDDDDIDTLLGLEPDDSNFPTTETSPIEKKQSMLDDDDDDDDDQTGSFTDHLASDFLSNVSAYPSSPEFITGSPEQLTGVDPYLLQGEDLDHQVDVKNPEDLEDFLESLDIPKNDPIKNFGPAESMQEPASLSHYLAQEAQHISSTQASSSEPLQPKKTSAEIEPSVKKKGKFVTTLLSALLVAGLCAAAGGYAVYQYSMSQVEANSKELDESSEQFKSTLVALTARAKQLEERLAKTDGQIAKIEGYYTSLQTEQSRVLQEQTRLNEQLASIKQESGEYEAAMIERLQSVLLLTRGISDQMSSQELRLKESVFKETVAALESRATGLGNEQLNAVLKDLQDNTTRLEQIEVNLQAQKTLLTLMGDETEFVKSRLGQMENRETKKTPPAPTRPSTTQSNSTAVNSSTKPNIPQKAPEQIAKELGWQIDIPNPHEESKSGYTLIGVLQKSPGVYEIYVQKKMARSATEYESYIYSPSEKSIIPGYGMIKGVQQTDSDSSVVPYQILTETGIIRGRMR